MHEAAAARLIARFRLTRREFDVAALAAQGLSNKEIAAALRMKLPTLCFHLSHVFRKIGLGDRYRLIRLFVEEEFRAEGR